jgi:Ca2+-binding RTX toxin-like protein
METIYRGDGTRYAISIGIEQAIGFVKHQYGKLKTFAENVAITARDSVDQFKGTIADLAGKTLNVLGFGEEDSFIFSGIKMGLSNFKSVLLASDSEPIFLSNGAIRADVPSVSDTMLVEIDSNLDGTADAFFKLVGDYSDYRLSVIKSTGNTIFKLVRAPETKFDIYGTSGDDTVVGTAAGDRLGGLDGNDKIKAKAGADTLDGGGGNDRLVGGGGADDLYGGRGDDIYVITDTKDKVFEYFNEGLDTVMSKVAYTLTINVENLTLIGKMAVSGTGNSLDNLIVGNGNKNVLSGRAGNDTIKGGGGNDILSGGAGRDILNGGDGFDMVDYSGASAGVVVKLKTGTARGGDGFDTLRLVEGIIGSDHDDTLLGNGDDNIVLAGAGDDLVKGFGGVDILSGGAGDDTLNGGDGVDIADYANATSAVEVDLVAGTATGGDGSDTLINLEGVNGSAFDDVLLGDGGDNTLQGGAGNDTLTGGGGMDRLSGGLGADHFAFDGTLNEGTDRITDFEDGTDIIDISGAVFADLTIAVATNVANTRVSLANGTVIILEGVDSSLIDASDFLFT